MKEFRNKGLAQKAFEEVEKIHGHDNWKLDTILQEEGNCYYMRSWDIKGPDWLKI